MQVLKLVPFVKDFVRRLLYAALPGVAVRRWILHRLPRVVNLEVTTACNLECPLCPTHLVPRATRFFDSKQLDQLLSANANLKMVCLHVQGEPLVHGQLFNMIRALSDRGVSTHVGTNGMLIKDHISELLESGLSSLSVAIDGANAEDYARYRKRGDFQTVVSGTRSLIAERNRRGAKLPHVQVQTIMFSYNEDRQPELTEFLESLKTDEISLKRPSYFGELEQWASSDSQVDQAKLKVHQERSQEFLREVDQDRKWARPTDRDDKNSYRNRPLCPQLEKGTILCDGRVVPCCMDGDGDCEFGNLRDESFNEIWRGARHQKTLEEFQAGTLAVCKNCTLSN